MCRYSGIHLYIYIYICICVYTFSILLYADQSFSLGLGPKEGGGAFTFSNLSNTEADRATNGSDFQPILRTAALIV